MTKRFTVQGCWLPAAQVSEETCGPMDVQVWDYRMPRSWVGKNHDAIIEGAVRRAIDLSDAMRCVVCIDIAEGGLIIGPGDTFEGKMKLYRNLRERAAK